MKKIILLITFLPSLLLTAADVLVNQLGYLPNSVKYVFVTNSADSFFVHNTSGQKLFSSGLQMYTLSDPSTGLTVYRGEFTEFSQPGEYFITTNTGDSSFVFNIDQNVYHESYKEAIKAFYYWRCGSLLLGAHAGPYLHAACHNGDGFYHSTTGLTGFRLVKGGWHDAGDYGKYIVNAGITVGTMLMAYELFPEKFSHDDLNIPESNNSVPDLLDEIRYELEWMLKMQNTDGGVFHKVTKLDFESFVMPNYDSGMRNIYQVSSTATGDFAAVMAMAYRSYKSYDSVFAGQCLSAARNAWTYLSNNPSIVPAGGFKNPEGTHTGEYGDGNDKDERLWAASELFLASGDEDYHLYFKNNYNKNGVLNRPMAWPDVNSLGQLSYLLSKNPSCDKSVQSTLLQGLKTYCDKMLSRKQADGLHVTLTGNEYNWGSNSAVMNNAIMLIIGYELTGNTEYFNTALDQLNYIYGVNVNNVSYVTGSGTKYIMNPHHRPSSADGIKEPVPGYIAGGPNKYLNDPVLPLYFNSTTPPAKCFIDHEGSYASNEVCINWNSPLVFVIGYFNAAGVTNVETGDISVPVNIFVDQNYPNPFNGSTIIRFTLNEQQDVSLKVVDVLGKEVFAKDLGMFNAGEHNINWTAVNLSSGMYCYYINGKEKSNVKTLVLLK